MNQIEQATEREACRKAFEFDLIDNWAYVESDFALDANGLYVDRDLYFAWECAWASWQAARKFPEQPAIGIPISALGQCWCTTCRPITLEDARFVVCPDCGNKRCPKAHNHELACTNSNAPGQPGSSWEHVKPLG